MYTTTSIRLAFGILAASLPTALSLGCYSKGTTWDDFQRRVPTSYYTSIWTTIANDMSGQYHGSERYALCYSYLNSGVHINVVVTNNSKDSAYLEWEDIFIAIGTERDACEHGSEQNHGGFWYALDPNDGPC
jgi:hypothetical protein